MPRQTKPTIPISELRELAAGVWPGVTLDCDTFGKRGEIITIHTSTMRFRFSNAHTRADPDRVRRQVKETLQSMRARVERLTAEARAGAGLQL